MPEYVGVEVVGSICGVVLLYLTAFVMDIFQLNTKSNVGGDPSNIKILLC